MTNTHEIKKKRILFIINPFSGVGKKKEVELLSERILSDEFEVDFKYTEYAKHAIEISSNSKDLYDIIVAVGGDGSVNEIGAPLVNSNCTFAIIPSGSGNGLARCLKIPINTEKAIQKIKAHNSRIIDTGIINNQVFLGTAGIGFDAHIGHLFEKKKVRGFLSYLPLIVKTYFKFENHNFTIQLDEKNNFSTEAWLITFCNSNQWGNEAYISPISILDDGKLRLAVLKKPKLFQVPKLVNLLFKGEIQKSALYSCYEFEKAEIQHELNEYHVDGESISDNHTLKVKVIKNSLKVIC